MNPTANPDMVTLVREAKGWTQTELADKADVTQGYVSKVENGLTEMTGERLVAVARALGCPPELLTNTTTRRGLEVSCMFHRRRTSKITVALGRKIEAVSHLTRITVDGLLNGVAIDSPSPIERMDIDDYNGDPEHVAQLLRARMRIPSGPIGNVFTLLDAAGIVVVIRPVGTVGTVGQDAFSLWPPNSRPIMVINTGLPVDRLRFTAMHELGHVAMHVMPNLEQESQANRFAAEFLMPAAEIRPQLAGLTTRDFNRLMGLKAEWKVSIAALIQRAKSLDLISDRQFREFRIKLSQLGWNSVEPLDLPEENPTLLDSVIAVHRNEHGYTDDELAKVAQMTPQAFRHYYLHEPQRPHLAVV